MKARMTSMSRLRVLAVSLLLLMTVTPSLADFVIEDIRVEGAQNIEIGTIFNYLPLKVGDRADEELINDSIKALFATGFFRDVEVRQDGDVLIVRVSERPAIATVEFSGNKDIKDEKIQEALLQVGVSEGRVFREVLLDQLVKSIQENYFSKGRYSAKVDTEMGRAHV